MERLLKVYRPDGALVYESHVDHVGGWSVDQDDESGTLTLRLGVEDAEQAPVEEAQAEADVAEQLGQLDAAFGEGEAWTPTPENGGDPAEPEQPALPFDQEA